MVNGHGFLAAAGGPPSESGRGLPAGGGGPAAGEIAVSGPPSESGRGLPIGRVGLAVGMVTAGSRPSESAHGAATVQTFGVERAGCEADLLADGWFRPGLSGADVVAATDIGISTNTPFISTSDVGSGTVADV